jgi:hypothetical protein
VLLGTNRRKTGIFQGHFFQGHFLKRFFQDLELFLSGKSSEGFSSGLQHAENLPKWVGAHGNLAKIQTEDSQHTEGV